jgi:hypothetical protein
MSLATTLHHVAFMRVCGHLVICSLADVSGNEFTTAVVAAVNDALPDLLRRRFRFVKVHGGTAGHIVHVDMMDTR